MKKLLIISPYFPPSNAADMQRVRMSIPYFKDLGWEPTVVCVAPQFTEIGVDDLLVKSIPSDIRVISIGAWSTKWTRKFGLGAIGIRSMNCYRKAINKLLDHEKFDLIYFSTTQFPILALGNYWKRKFKIPYVIDLQDPWISNYYDNKPRKERPKKYWFAQLTAKILEPIAMNNCGGLIAVSDSYIEETKARHVELKNCPSKTITFGAFPDDLAIAEANRLQCPSILNKKLDEVSIGYIGRGGYDMYDALRILFSAFQQGLKQNPVYFQRIHFYFLGTSYAADGRGIPTIKPLADTMGLGSFVTEHTDRIPFYQTLNTLKDFDALFICGSNDPRYTASKVYPYISVKKPLIGIFHHQSSAVNIINECKAGKVVAFDMDLHDQIQLIVNFLTEISTYKNDLDLEAFSKYSAATMAKQQCLLFEKVIINDLSNQIAPT